MSVTVGHDDHITAVSANGHLSPSLHGAGVTESILLQPAGVRVFSKAYNNAGTNLYGGIAANVAGGQPVQMLVMTELKSSKRRQVV